MKLTNPPLTRGLGKTRSISRKGRVPGTPSTQGLAQTVSIDGREKGTLEERIREIGLRSSLSSAELGELFAESLIRFEVSTTASGADASIAIMVRASVNDAFEEAGIYLDANVSGLGGASRVRITADNVVISDGTDDLPAFEIVGGILYLRNTVLVKGIDDDVVDTNHIKANAVTQLVAAEGTGDQDVVDVAITRTLGTVALIVAHVALNIDSVSFASLAVSQLVAVRRDSTTLYSETHFASVVDWTENAGGNTTDAFVAGTIAIQLVDDDVTVSGAKTYTLDINTFDADFASISVIEFKR